MLKITLNTDEIKKFLQVSAGIDLEDRKFSAPLSYLKLSFSFGTCTITKANLESHCKYEFDCGEFMEDAVVFVDFKVLTTLMGETKSKTFWIETDGIITWLKDGYYKHKFSSSDVTEELYPLTEECENDDFFTLNIDVLNAIKIAKNSIGNDPIRPQFSFCYIDKGTVYSTDAFTLCVKKVTSQTPTGLLALSKKECILLSNFNYIGISQTDSWNFFRFENSTFGFRKAEGGLGFQYEWLVNQLKRDNYIVVKVEDIINFCASTIALNESKISTSKLTAIEDGNTALNFEDEITSLANQLHINCGLIGGKFEYLFEPDRLMTLLKVLGYNEICIGYEGQRVSVWNSNDVTFLGMIQNVVPQQRQ